MSSLIGTDALELISFDVEVEGISIWSELSKVKLSKTELSKTEGFKILLSWISWSTTKLSEGEDQGY